MIDVCKNIDDVNLKQYNMVSNTFSVYYFFSIIKLAIYPCVLYAVYIYILMLNHIDVRFEYRNITIPIFVFFVLFIFPCYQLFIPIFKERRMEILEINNLDKIEHYGNIWRTKLLSASYIALTDLIIAKKYNLLTHDEYCDKKTQYVKQSSNRIVTNAKKMVFYNDSDKAYFNEFGQSDINNITFVSIVELRKTLEISDDEFVILKSNFIDNDTLADINDLESLKRLNIITEFEYYKKLYNQEKQLRLRREWQSKITITNIIIVSIIGLVTFAVSK